LTTQAQRAQRADLLLLVVAAARRIARMVGQLVAVRPCAAQAVQNACNRDEPDLDGNAAYCCVIDNLGCASRS
jgi:histone H3/H4